MTEWMQNDWLHGACLGIEAMGAGLVGLVTSGDVCCEEEGLRGRCIWMDPGSHLPPSF